MPSRVKKKSGSSPATKATELYSKSLLAPPDNFLFPHQHGLVQKELIRDMKAVLNFSLSCPPSRNAGYQTTIPFDGASSAPPPQPQALPISSLLPPRKGGKAPALDPAVIVRPTCDADKDIVQVQQMDATHLLSSVRSVKRGLLLGENQRVKYRPIALAVGQPQVIESARNVPSNPCTASASTAGRSNRGDTAIDSDMRACPRPSARSNGAEEQMQHKLSRIVRRFKPLRVHQNAERIEVRKSSEEKPSESSPNGTKELQITRYPTMDDDVTPLIIGNPPRISLRRKVEKLARTLALIAFNAFGDSPGKLLIVFSALSRTYRYASTLAFTHLIALEFAGARTASWLEAKNVDIRVADLRDWYWHRASERRYNIGKLRNSWMNRVWKFLARNDGCLVKGNSLFFEGIGSHLFAEPDIRGQLDVAIRFWIRRFYTLVGWNGGGYPQLLADLKMGKVHQVGLSDEKSRSIWKVETRAGKSLFVVGKTGEVVRVAVEPQWALSGSIADTEAQSPAVGVAKLAPKCKGKASIPAHYGRAGDDLGSLLLPPPLATSTLRENYLRHPLQFAVPEASIHRSITLRHHRALAERWVLSNLDADEISRDFTLGPDPGVLVESVRCSGEKWNSSMKSVLAPGIGFVQASGTGWLVLEETGQVCILVYRETVAAVSHRASKREGKRRKEKKLILRRISRRRITVSKVFGPRFWAFAKMEPHYVIPSSMDWSSCSGRFRIQ
ncbi:unnamed protein product [Tuber aestivum]|uniref:Uncharacterized protein n=1 Tax=Tuber aestivum TaxID=59557 RepID=A0A292Q8C5_9PEZI|nr:unnamed protein product [Tuber aestivum]